MEKKMCLWWRRGRVELPVQKIPWGNVLQAYSAFCSRAPELLLTESPGSQPNCLTLSISVSEQRHPGFMTPASPPPELVGADAAVLFRRLERKLCRCCQLLFCHLFFEMGGTSACNSPEYSPVEPTRPHVAACILCHNMPITSIWHLGGWRSCKSRISNGDDTLFGNVASDEKVDYAS